MGYEHANQLADQQGSGGAPPGEEQGPGQGTGD